MYFVAWYCVAVCVSVCESIEVYYIVLKWPTWHNRHYALKPGLSCMYTSLFKCDDDANECTLPNFSNELNKKVFYS